MGIKEYFSGALLNFLDNRKEKIDNFFIHVYTWKSESNIINHFYEELLMILAMAKDKKEKKGGKKDSGKPAPKGKK